MMAIWPNRPPPPDPAAENRDLLGKCIELFTERRPMATPVQKQAVDEVVLPMLRALQVDEAIKVAPPSKPGEGKADEQPKGGQATTKKEEEKKEDEDDDLSMAEVGAEQGQEGDQQQQQMEYYRVLDQWHRHRPQRAEGQPEADYNMQLAKWLDQGPTAPTQPPNPKRTRRTGKEAVSSTVGPAGAAADAAGSAQLALCG